MQPDFLSVAESCRPVLHRVSRQPVQLVRPVADAAAFQGWRMQTEEGLVALPQRLLRRGDTLVFDFGVHLVGQLQLSISPEPAADAPTRLKLTFGEVPAEIAEAFDPFTGEISRNWLQDEVVNIDVLPQTLTLPRRYAFRYVKIEVVDTAPAYKIRLQSVVAQTVSSAEAAKVSPLPASVEERLRRIDEVSLRTLANCMQTVFEDGPKRDRRLWLGDLRLQALANYASFGNTALVKRCLALFAGLRREDGFANADMYEAPTPHLGNCRILDYSSILGATVLDYLRASGDREFAMAMWPVVLKQVELLQYVNAEGLFVDPGNWWIFIDWKADLDKTAAMHGVLMYGMQQTLELAGLLGREADVARLKGQVERMRQAAQMHLWDAKLGAFVSGKKRQVSWASQAWMVLGEVVGAAEGADIFKRLETMPEAVRPAGPYLYHHVVHAMLLCGLKREAGELIARYWGGMVDRGATTFWEVFDPADDRLTPYKNHLINSYCHAWSCTPTWFIRKWLS